MGIFYYSTNRGHKDGFNKKVTFAEALFMGMAPDKGLFMPTEIPHISKEEILSFKGKPYHETAFQIMRKFLHDDISDNELRQLVKDSYNFGVPTEKIDDITYIAWLDKGPTAAFKDFAALVMARLMNKLKPAGKKLTILVATSGDTGSAMGEAYRGIEDISIVILYPENGVSSVQKKHMDSIGKNVITLEVKGTFDDCQKLVKEAFSDPELRKINLASANSINVGRVIPQIAYYFHVYANVAKNFEKIVFSIPSGNFGNSLGCEIARRMGLPVEKIIIAVNKNDGFPRFLESGKYSKIEPSISCISNAMDIGNPSNLARYFELYGGNIDKDGMIHKMPNLDEMRKNLYSVSISDEETIKTMKKTYKDNGIMLDPHGAVGVAALEKYRKKHGKMLSICMETAHPGKFPEAMKKALNIVPELPESLKSISGRKGKSIKIQANYPAFKKTLLKTVEK